MRFIAIFGHFWGYVLLISESKSAFYFMSLFIVASWKSLLTAISIDIGRNAFENCVFFSLVLLAYFALDSDIQRSGTTNECQSVSQSVSETRYLLEQNEQKNTFKTCTYYERNRLTILPISLMLKKTNELMKKLKVDRMHQFFFTFENVETS